MFLLTVSTQILQLLNVITICILGNELFRPFLGQILNDFENNLSWFLVF
jgi:uncharacterized membrane protein